MTTHRIEGVATVLSSITHGGEHAGTTGYLRREKVTQPDGSVVEVPIVSGNALRGILRDQAATIFHELIGEPELPLPVFHLLWSGGALAKAGAGHVLGARQLAEVRRLVPVISVFGGSGAGKIIEGKLMIGKFVPICAETAHLVPPELVPPAVRSIWDMLQIEEFTRRDDGKRDLLHHAVAGFRPRELPSGEQAEVQGALLTVDEHQPAVEDEVDGPAQQMRYGFETIAAGTTLHWWMALRDVNDVETALVAAAIERWMAHGAHIGGRSATGHGRLRLDVAQWTHEAPRVTVGQALAVRVDVLAEHVAQHRDEILQALDLFA